MKITILLALAAFVVAFALTAANASEVAGPGPHYVIDGNSRVVGVVVDGAVVVVPNLPTRKLAPADHVVPFRLQTQRVLTEPRSWNPEPAGCPRGVKVLRYGSWGC